MPGLPGWLARVVPFWPAAAGAALAILLVGAAGNQRTLACARDRGQCTWSTRSFLSTDQRAFPIASVREVRFVDGLGKHGRQARPALVFASGHQLDLHADDRDDARTRYDALARFFAGRGDPTVRDHTGPHRGLYLAAAAAAIAAVVLAIRGWMRGPAQTYLRPRPTAATAAPARGRYRYLKLLVAVVALAVVAQLALLYVSSQVNGTLELECRTRCRFQGAECLPGGSVRMDLAAGDYTIDVWAAAGPDLWTPRPFTIRTGERTRFVCAP